MVTRALAAAKSVKHAGFVASKNLRRAALETSSSAKIRWGSFRFDPSRYPSHRFLGHSAAQGESRPVPRRVFVLWTGRNAMPAVRVHSLRRLEDSLGVPMELVTPDDLPRWILPEHPLHPGYELLSLTHRSDYLRAYLLHHHGGGYTDVKQPTASWGPVFNVLAAREDLWMAGYPEDSTGRVPRLGGSLERDLRLRFSDLVGTGAFVARPATPLTAEWLREVERRLDYFMDLLEVAPGGVRDEAPGYVVGWTQILADVLYPLMLKYRGRIHRTDALLPSFVDYR
ncbi:glycosyltransferase family 32 protein [Micrococcus luteus]|uniref:hypothetical protein n=1 Tax=Micrococcus luteus TaxID=1270 RepID=UPI0011A5BD65|nr:hypothetical protein [Micrococcus luteus]